MGYLPGKVSLMQESQRIDNTVDEAQASQARSQAVKTGESLEEESKSVHKSWGDGQPKVSDDGPNRNGEDDQPQPDLEAQEREKQLRRAQQEERNRKQREEEWKAFMRAEREALELRRGGELARSLGDPLPGEPPEELRRLASEDQQQAEEGLVALMSGGKLHYKRLDELSREDMPARVAAERLRTTWLKKRRDSWLARGWGAL